MAFEAVLVFLLMWIGFELEKIRSHVSKLRDIAEYRSERERAKEDLQARAFHNALNPQDQV